MLRLLQAHTVYSLLNHSCTPNVRWSCSGIVRFWGTQGLAYNPPPPEDGPRSNGGGAHTLRLATGGEEDARPIAVHSGHELWSCYCDPELPVAERRAWMMGCLGGVCMCTRCLAEE